MRHSRSLRHVTFYQLIKNSLSGMELEVHNHVHKQLSPVSVVYDVSPGTYSSPCFFRRVRTSLQGFLK